jgi:hypothetical protein
LLVNWFSHLYKSHYHWNNCWNDDRPLECELIITKLKKLSTCGKELVIFNLEQPHQASEKNLKDIFNAASGYKNSFAPHSIRDPLNWVASYIFKTIKNTSITEINRVYDKYCDWWWDIYAKDYYNWLTCEFPINYNVFVKSFDYRKNIAKTVGLDLDQSIDDNVLNTLFHWNKHCPPSSFDVERIKNGIITAKEMDVEHRYHKIAFLYNKIPNHIKEIAEKTWNLTKPPTNDFLQI